MSEILLEVPTVKQLAFQEQAKGQVEYLLELEKQEHQAKVIEELKKEIPDSVTIDGFNLDLNIDSSIDTFKNIEYYQFLTSVPALKKLAIENQQNLARQIYDDAYAKGWIRTDGYLPLGEYITGYIYQQQDAMLIGNRPSSTHYRFDETYGSVIEFEPIPIDEVNKYALQNYFINSAIASITIPNYKWPDLGWMKFYPQYKALYEENIRNIPYWQQNYINTIRDNANIGLGPMIITRLAIAAVSFYAFSTLSEYVASLAVSAPSAGGTSVGVSGSAAGSFGGEVPLGVGAGNFGIPFSEIPNVALAQIGEQSVAVASQSAIPTASIAFAGSVPLGQSVYIPTVQQVDLAGQYVTNVSDIVLADYSYIPVQVSSPIDLNLKQRFENTLKNIISRWQREGNITALPKHELPKRNVVISDKGGSNSGYFSSDELDDIFYYSDLAVIASLIFSVGFLVVLFFSKKG